MEINFIPEKNLNNHVKGISTEALEMVIEYTKKKVCKIYCNDGGKGTGFFCIIPINEWDNLRVLMTNNHVVGEKELNIGKKIKFTLDNDKEEKEIIIDKKRIKYTNKKYDVTIIEIKKNDGIKNESFFELDNKVFDDYKIYIKKTVYLLHYPEGKEMTFSEGLIKNIYEDKYSIEHLCDSRAGSSGGPLINSINYRVIGIHKGGGLGEKMYNLGTLILKPIEEFKITVNKIIEIKKENKEAEQKYIYENGDYYIGQSLNGLKHGKGIYYNKNNTILYEGDFVLNKIEGKGKYYWENGEYYIGEWLNGHRHGKGILYYKNNLIKYEGDFVNGKYEGKGQYNYKNGNFYIGEWLNGLRHGKGILFKRNNIIEYEGDFLNNEFEGKGKYFYEDGEYYVGDWINGLRHGKGKIYYKNNTIKYEGDFAFDKPEGNGKCIYEDGDYYIGEFLNGLSHGKGILYSKNNKIKYKGNFINGKYKTCIIF